jgi:deoxyribodipyrimidine photolyase-related protein
MGPVFRTWDKMNEDRREAVLKGAAQVLDDLDAGRMV